MASLKLDHVYKMYSDGVKAVNDFSLDVKDGEFVVFVGPSGCGKSTTLRMIAGLENITAGGIYIDGQMVNNIEPKNRDIAMVFQNYALYPQMTVYENLAFGLRIRHMPEEEIRKKVIWASTILGLTEYLDKKPRAMSGGQRQRVALGRAILRNPKVMLLDEPLSNLDAKLRTTMRSEIAKLHKKLKTTFLYVTHDQVEAMTLGDRVVVMNKGSIQQVDTPSNLYSNPKNMFVAGFIGTPQMNFIDVTLDKKDDKIIFNFPNEKKISVDSNKLLKLDYSAFGRKAVFGIRAEDVYICGDDDPDGLTLEISHVEDLGSSSLVYGQFKGDEDLNNIIKKEFVFQIKNKKEVEGKTIVNIKFDFAKSYLFDKETQLSLINPEPENSFLPLTRKNSKAVICKDIETPFEINIEEGKKYLLSIPTEAIVLKKDGSYVGRVISKENVSDQKYLYSLKLQDNILFFYSNKDDLHDEVRFNILFSKCTVLENNKIIVKPIDLETEFVTKFESINSHEAANDEMNKLVANQVKEIEEVYKSKENEIREKREQEIEKIKSISNEKKNIQERIKSVRHELLTGYFHDFIVGIKFHIESNKEKRNTFHFKSKEIKEKYETLIKQENEAFREALNKGGDKNLIEDIKDDHARNIDSLKEQRGGELISLSNSIDLDFSSKELEKRQNRKRQRAQEIDSLRQLRRELKQISNPTKWVDNEIKKKIRENKKHMNDEIREASKKFLLKLDARSEIILPNEVSSKILRALGSKAFSKKILLIAPSDSLVIDKNKGIPFVINGYKKLDGESFIELSHLGLDGGKSSILLRANEGIYKKNQTIFISIDINKCKIKDASNGMIIC